ncbi:ABC transporter permease [Mesorhizobium sp. STM 4661]|uniref:ABC transporter permease n=1 Tax=Mesorhizobium sp. STM 4661 TaxID=1297570 RepID=UPI0002BD6F90|nr:ABC transporter permease [Mesorhizobium sp. STM 4661]CCV13727.1 ABC transporter, permease [Mesorhizobium sp. STM 4661]
MSAYLARRLRNSLLLLVIASVLCFGLVVAAPGNVAQMVAELRFPGAPKEMVDRIAEELGINDPVPLRYWNWLRGVTRGDFGIGYITGEDVGKSIRDRLPTTIKLVLGGSIVTIILSSVMGLIGAARPARMPDQAVRFLALLGASTPVFFGGAILILVFGVLLQWLPTYGDRSLQSWILPSVTIALSSAAVLSRVLRIGISEAMTRPYVLTARAKGAPMLRIMLLDALPNAVPAYVSALGNMIGAMTIGAIIVEPLFALHGIGELFVAGIRSRDFMVMQACLLVFVLYVTLVNLAADLVMIAVDPKLRRQFA